LPGLSRHVERALWLSAHADDLIYKPDTGGCSAFYHLRVGVVLLLLHVQAAHLELQLHVPLVAPLRGDTAPVAGPAIGGALIEVEVARCALPGVVGRCLGLCLGLRILICTGAGLSGCSQCLMVLSENCAHLVPWCTFLQETATTSVKMCEVKPYNEMP